MTIWFNKKLDAAAVERLRAGVGAHRLVLAAGAHESVLAPGAPDLQLAEAEIAFGQPDPAGCLASPRLRWAHLSSAGYTRYDRPEVLEEFRRRQVALTNSSSVYADPCAQHALAMILAAGRGLLPAYRNQLADRRWDSAQCRAGCSLLTGQTVLLLGFGAIGRRLADLLAPFGCAIYAVRRQTRSERAVRVVPEEDLTRVLGLADHVVNLLPENGATRHWVNARRLSCLRPGSRFYNIGRGATVDQDALLEALRSGRLASASLDVTSPEPLPPGHALWTEPRCFITPHAAGGRLDEDDALVALFLRNLAAFQAGEPLSDRIV